MQVREYLVLSCLSVIFSAVVTQSMLRCQLQLLEQREQSLGGGMPLLSLTVID